MMTNKKFNTQGMNSKHIQRFAEFLKMANNEQLGAMLQSIDTEIRYRKCRDCREMRMRE